MLSARRLAGALVVVALLIGAPAHAGCKKSLALREIPGGEPQPAQKIECDESEPPALLEQSAHLRLCDAEALARTGASFEDCARAVDAARAGLRRAKIRAALREGVEKEEIEARYGTAAAEIDALRASADWSGPIPAGSEADKEAAQ